jgi:hypothetical protein
MSFTGTSREQNVPQSAPSQWQPTHNRNATLLLLWQHYQWFKYVINSLSTTVFSLIGMDSTVCLRCCGCWVVHHMPTLCGYEAGFVCVRMRVCTQSQVVWLWLVLQSKVGEHSVLTTLRLSTCANQWNICLLRTDGTLANQGPLLLDPPSMFWVSHMPIEPILYRPLLSNHCNSVPGSGAISTQGVRNWPVHAAQAIWSVSALTMRSGPRHTLWRAM